MSRRFFSADFHLGSTNILKYAHRKWHTAIEAVDAVIEMVNEKCDKSDVLIHCGDFILSGKDNHDDVSDVGLDIKQNDYLRRFKPNVFLLNGNHDSSHNAESFASNMWLDLNYNWKHVFASHFPSYNQFYRGPNREDKHEWDPAIALCGHVHDSWLLHYDNDKHVLNLNVGLDVWNCKVVEDVQLTMMLDFLKEHMWKDMNGKSRIVMSRERFDMFKVSKQKEAEAARIQRKKEKFERLGLTPEECERRKTEAMKAKGLI